MHKQAGTAKSAEPTVLLKGQAGSRPANFPGNTFLRNYCNEEYFILYF
jgi:hypothetical protein